MTGAIVGVDITGRDGLTLQEAWADGPKTYLGLMAAGFPNLFMITGPGSPSVLSNMMVSIEQHVDWIADCIDRPPRRRLDTIEPTEDGRRRWVQHVNDYADITLMPQANSWYMGANVPGQAAGLPALRRAASTATAGCATRSWPATTSASSGADRRAPRRVDGVIRRVQPDVAIMLELLDSLGLPTYDSMSPAEARAFSDVLAAQRPPGPEVGEVVDGTLPGPAGDLAYRLYRPPTTGPHPIIVYFHGGGWVLGSQTSDDPFCRDLCVRIGRGRRLGQLPPRAGGPVPGRGRRRVRRGALGRRPRRTSVASRASWPSPAGAPAATWPPSCASSPATPAVRRSPASCW